MEISDLSHKSMNPGQDFLTFLFIDFLIYEMVDSNVVVTHEVVMGLS